MINQENTVSMALCGHSWLAQNQSFNHSAWLFHLWKCTEERVGEVKEKERDRRKDLAKLIIPKVELQGREDPQHWASSLIYRNTHGIGGNSHTNKNNFDIITLSKKIHTYSYIYFCLHIYIHYLYINNNIKGYILWLHFLERCSPILGEKSVWMW